MAEEGRDQNQKTHSRMNVVKEIKQIAQLPVPDHGNAVDQCHHMEQIGGVDLPLVRELLSIDPHLEVAASWCHVPLPVTATGQGLTNQEIASVRLLIGTVVVHHPVDASGQMKEKNYDLDHLVRGEALVHPEKIQEPLGLQCVVKIDYDVPQVKVNPQVIEEIPVFLLAPAHPTPPIRVPQELRVGVALLLLEVAVQALKVAELREEASSLNHHPK